MTFQSWLLFLTIVLTATTTPGPAVAFIMSKTMIYGRKKALIAAAGNISGLFVIGLVSVAGLGAILQTSNSVFNIIKYLGAVYLVYLGVKLIIGERDIDIINEHKVSNKPSITKLFFQAFCVALSNPKAIILLTALLPQFIDLNSPLFPQFFLLILTLMICSFIFLMAYAVLAEKIMQFITNQKRMRFVYSINGLLLIFFGILLATATH
jgi:threonine/homoserine/homoserine lactone efflux protein